MVKNRDRKKKDVNKRSATFAKRKLKIEKRIKKMAKKKTSKKKKGGKKKVASKKKKR